MDWTQILQSEADLSEAAVSEVIEAIQSGTAPERALRNAGLSNGAIRNHLASYYGVEPYTYSADEPISNNALQHMPEDSARYYKVIPVSVTEGLLTVAATNLDDLQMRQAVQFLARKYGLPHQFVFILNEELETALQAYESLTGEVDEALGSLEQQLTQEIAQKEKEASSKGAGTQANADHLKEDAPVTKIVATILRYAVDGKASDIHIEPGEHNIAVRFRVDGDLQKSLELPLKVSAALVARVKILSSMRLDEKRKPQDGRFSANFDGRKIDFRVSVLPTNHGEKVVMRILDTAKGIRTLEDTGIEPHHLEVIRRMVKEPYGIILISGPTGSGKSTTLYAMLSEIDRLSKNVLSLEDPVEYNIDNVSQSQVRPEIGYTFADGLRSALRQDPDIIMVGEIRDQETAQLAIQAALTGHLVLSTIHTNNSIGVIPRLIDMGVDPYLIAPTLKVAIAQRLSRRLCPGSGDPVPVAGALESMVNEQFSTLPKEFHHRLPKSDTMMRPASSPGCATGTKGRAAVMEVFEVDDEIQELILNNGSEEEMYAVARKKGFMTVKEDAIIKALKHVIPYEEINMFGSGGAVDLYDVEEQAAPATPVVNPETLVSEELGGQEGVPPATTISPPERKPQSVDN